MLLAVAAARAQVVTSPDFGIEAVGATTGQQSVLITAPNGGTVASVAVLTLGAPNLDFKANAGFPCVTGLALTRGETCVQSVTFTPQFVGQRVGAVEILDASGNVLGTSYIHGIGQSGLGVFVTGNLNTVAGDGLYLDPGVGDGGLAVDAELFLPSSVALDGSGNMYIADTLHQRIRMVNAATGNITTLAGNGSSSDTGDNGLAVNATLSFPSGIILDGAGNIFIADTGNNKVREIVASTGNIITVAGNGTPGFAGDGLVSTSANVELYEPQGVSIDDSGNLYIADTLNQRIRRVDTVTGIINTIAGNGAAGTNGPGSGTFSGDNAPAAAAGLSQPYAVAFDLAGNMYIPDSSNNRIRRVMAVNEVISGNSVITTYAGTGTVGYSGDGGLATAANLSSPADVVVDPAGNLYISDTQNKRIRKVRASNQFITSFTENSAIQYLDLTKTFRSVDIDGPLGLYLDGSGNLYIADSLNMKIRQIQSNLVALDFTTPVRQGSKSTYTINQTVENDGNWPLDLSTIVASANVTTDPQSTTCLPTLQLAMNVDCVVGVIFSPATTANNTGYLWSNIDVAANTVNTPLDIEVSGYALAVNSTTTTIASAPDPSGFGQNVTFTVTVTTGENTGALSGVVDIYDTFGGVTTTLASNLALNGNGVATYQTASLAVGLHNITAAYDATKDPSHFGSKSTDYGAPLVQTVYESTTIKLASSQNPSAVGQSVTFTATVTAQGNAGVAPDGTVTFADGSKILCDSVPLVTVAGVTTASCVPPNLLTQGVHAITANYSGDATNQIQGSGPAQLSQDVLSPTTIALVSAQNPSYFGVPVTLTATVTSNGSPAATGTINFLDGTTIIGTSTLAPATGIASFTISTLAVGAHNITASYLGDANNASSNSASVIQTVTQTITSTSVAVLPNPGIAGATEVITATVKVTAGAATPTGTITFTDGTVTLGTAAMASSGTASIHPTLTSGQHMVVATYGGDTDDGGSVSAQLLLTVVLATTNTALSSTPNPSVVLSSVAFTAKVTSNGGVPGGSVNFIADGSLIGTANLDSTGTATLNYSSLLTGNHAVTAVYGGDTDDAQSNSAVLTQVVITIPTVTSLGTSTTSSGTNPQVILVATVVGTTGTPIPSGTVTFNTGSTVIGAAPLDSSGVAILLLNLPSGTYNIVGTYGGDALHSPSTSPVSSISTTATDYNLTVTPASVTLATSQNISVTVTLTSNSNFTDTVNLGCGSLPAGVTCHFASTSAKLTPNAVATVQLTIDTNNPLSGGTTAMNQSVAGRRLSLTGLFPLFSMFCGWGIWGFRRRKPIFLSMIFVLMLAGVGLMTTGCTSFTQSSAAPGTYVIQVNGVGANSQVSHYQNVTLTITK